MAEGDNNFGIIVTIQDGSAEGARSYKRSTDDVAASAKKAQESTEGLKKGMSGLKESAHHAKEGADELKEGLKELKESLEGVKEALEKIEHSTELLNKGLKAIGIGSVIVEFKELFEVGKELEEAFTHLQIVAGATGEEMEELEAKTASLSNAFGQSQIKVAAVQLEAARSGFKSVTENTEVTTAALELAKIGFVDAGTAADALTRIMQSYGVSAEGAKSVSESLFIAAKSGKFDIGELNQVFGRLGPAIQESGISINQALASLSALGQTGTNTRIAMAGVQQILRSVAEPTSASQKAFENVTKTLHGMGIEAGSLQELVGERGLQGAIATLYKAVGGDKETLGKLFGGQQAGAAAYALATTAAKAYGDTIEELGHKSEIAAQADKEKTEGAAFQAEQFRARVQNAFQGLAGQSLEALTPVFKFLNEHFAALEVLAGSLAAALVAKLGVSLLSTAANFLKMGTAAVAAAAETKIAAVAAGEAAVGITAEGVAASTAAVGLTALETAVAFLGGPVTIAIGLLAALAGVIHLVHKSESDAEEATKTFGDQLDALAKKEGLKPREQEKKEKEETLGKAPEEDDLTKNYKANLERRTDLLKKTQQLQQEVDNQTGVPNTKFSDSIEGHFLEEYQKKLEDVTGDIEWYEHAQEQIQSKRYEDSAAGPAKPSEDVLALRKAMKEPQDAGVTAAAEGAEQEGPVKPDVTDAVKMGEVQKDAAAWQSLKDTWDKASQSAIKLKDARTVLELAQKQGATSPSGTQLDPRDVTLLMQNQREEIDRGTDAYTKHQDKLNQLVAANDPVMKATLDHTEAVKKLKQQYWETTGRVVETGEAFDRLDAKWQKSQIANAAKIQEAVAPTPEAKTFVGALSTQSQNLIDAIELQKEGKISVDELQAAYVAAGLAIDKAAIATQALTTGEMKLAQARQATKEASVQAANDPHLSDDARVQFMRQFQVAQDDAARSADTLGLRIEKLAGTYSPLISIAAKYRDLQSEIDSLSRNATPEQKVQLQQVAILAPLQQKQDTDKALVLPALDKNATAALDEYQLTFAKLALELESGTISQNQFNQAVLETHQAFVSANAEFDDFTKAVVDGGKVMGDALEKSLTTPTKNLRTAIRGFGEDIAKGLQQNAASILSKQLETKAFSQLAKVAPDTAGMLAKGAGVQLQADKVPEKAQLSTNESSALEARAIAATAPTAVPERSTDSASISSIATATSSTADSARQIVNLLSRGVNNGSGGVGGGGSLGGIAANDDELSPIQTTAQRMDASGLGQGWFSSAANDDLSPVKVTAQKMDTSDFKASSKGSLSVAGGNDPNLSGYENDALGAGEGLATAAATGGNVGQAAESEAKEEAIKFASQQAAKEGSKLLTSLFSSGGGFAAGGDVHAGQTAMVGENGPERVTFGSDAHVTPNDQVRAATASAAGNRGPTVVSSPNVTVPVQVVNVSDPNDVPMAMNGPAGQKAITNYLSQNRSTVNSILGN